MSKTCYKCGAPVEAGSLPQIQVLDGVSYRGLLPSLNCTKCEEVTISLNALERFELLVAQKVLQHTITNPDVFQFVRKALGHTREDQLQMLGHCPESLLRKEPGSSLDEASDLGLSSIAFLRLMVEDRLQGKDTTERFLTDRLTDSPTAEAVVDVSLE